MKNLHLLLVFLLCSVSANAANIDTSGTAMPAAGAKIYGQTDEGTKGWIDGDTLLRKQGDTTLTLGTQNTASGKLLVAHTEPTNNTLAFMGVVQDTFTWTNNGTYYNNTGFFGWNPDGRQTDEPKVGLSVESKYSHSSGQPFGSEIHLVASFPDTKSVRAFTTYIDRAAPHLAYTQLAGQIEHVASDTSGSQPVRSRFYENGQVRFYQPGTTFEILNYGASDANTGHGALFWQGGDDYPYLAFKKSGNTKSSIDLELDLGRVVYNVGYVTGGDFVVRGGRLTLEPQGDPGVFMSRGTNDYIQFTEYGDTADAAVDFKVKNTGEIISAAGLKFRPPASVTPAVNGQMTFELTSDTSLTIKVKGSDGTVRSAVLTLAP